MLKRKYNQSFKEGLPKDPNRKLIIRLIRTLLLSQGKLAQQQLGAESLQDLQSYCIGYINKFTNRSAHAQNPTRKVYDF